MIKPQKYLEVAARAAWSGLLLKLGFRERAEAAYGDAALLAFELTLNFKPVDVTAPLTGNAATGHAITITHSLEAPAFDVRVLQRQLDAQLRGT